MTAWQRSWGGPALSSTCSSGLKSFHSPRSRNCQTEALCATGRTLDVRKGAPSAPSGFGGQGIGSARAGAAAPLAAGSCCGGGAADSSLPLGMSLRS